MRVAVAGNEAWNDINMLVVNILESLLHQLCGQVGINDMLAQLLFRADEVA